MRDAKGWNRMTRKPKEGAHLYIPQGIIDQALEHAEIPKDAPRLEVRAYSMRTSDRRTARVLLKIREVRE